MRCKGGAFSAGALSSWTRSPTASWDSQSTVGGHCGDATGNRSVIDICILEMFTRFVSLLNYMNVSFQKLLIGRTCMAGSDIVLGFKLFQACKLTDQFGADWG